MFNQFDFANQWRQSYILGDLLSYYGVSTDVMWN